MYPLSDKRFIQSNASFDWDFLKITLKVFAKLSFEGGSFAQSKLPVFIIRTHFDVSTCPLNTLLKSSAELKREKLSPYCPSVRKPHSTCSSPDKIRSRAIFIMHSLPKCQSFTYPPSRRVQSRSSIFFTGYFQANVFLII